MPPLDPVPIQISSDSDDSSVVELVSETQRQPATQPWKATPSSRSKKARPVDTVKGPNALSQPHNFNGVSVYLRSDTTDPGGGKVPQKTVVADSEQPRRKKQVARKSLPSGSPSRAHGRNPSSINDSSDERLPDDVLEPTGRALLVNGQGPRGTLNGMGNGVKRPRDSGGSSSAGGTPVKKARISDHHANGRPASLTSSSATKKGTTKSTMQNKAIFLSSSLNLSKDNIAPTTKSQKKNAFPRVIGGDDDSPSPQSMTNQRANGTTGARRPDPFAALQASQKERSARQQATTQEERSRTSSEIPKAASPRPVTSSRPQSKASSRPSPSSASQESSAKTSLPKELTDLSVAIHSRGSPAGRSSSERNESTGQHSMRTSSSGPSRALKLLSDRSRPKGEPRSSPKRVAASDDDQGYASQSSGQAIHRRYREQREDASGLKSPLQKARLHPRYSSEKPTDTPKGRLSNSTKPERQLQKANESLLDDDTRSEKATEKLEALHSSKEAAVTSLGEASAKGHAASEKSRSVPDGSQNQAPPNISLQEETAPVETVENGLQSPTRSDKFEAAAEAAEADDQLQSEALRDLEQRQSIAQQDKVFALPQSAASTLKSTAAYAKLPLAAKVEKVLGQYLEALAEDNECGTSASLMRARTSKDQNPEARTQHSEESTSFKHIKPLKVTPWQKGDLRELTWGIERMASGKPISSTKIIVPRHTFTTNTQDVPRYAHYVSIKNNILAPNTKTLHCWPYFGDDFDSSKAENLQEQYYMDISDRENKLKRLRQAQKYEEYVECALADLECSWADVLRFLLDPSPVVGLDPDAARALSNREALCKEEFKRDSKRWVAVLSSLPPSEPEKTGRAAVLCENFQKLANFPLWHIAKRSNLCDLPENVELPRDDSLASDELTCRICLRFNCPYHGELSERPDAFEEDDDSDEAAAKVVATDLVHPPKINYRTRVAFPAPQPSFEEDEKAMPRADRKDLRYWQNFQNKADARGPFYPCSHPGKSCDEAGEDNCSCVAENLPCEKFCGCDHNCNRKFQGCSCATHKARAGKRGLCFDDERCTCWQLGRECDPDLCAGCGVCEVVDPVNKHDDDILRGRCHNASIQRAMPKCTLLGDSGVHGLGLYACEDIQTNDFVGEYKGEIITKEEAERRGAVYEHQKLSYLFSLNKDQEIDSTYFGNKIRFINHAAAGRSNLYPRIIMVTTVHRIALYAARHIRKGEELLFDYGPQFPNEQLGGTKSKKSAPHVRNANLTKDFFEVEEDQDELGNVRAKGVSSGTGGRKNKPGKSRGGARPGAGRKPRKKLVERPMADDVDEQRQESPFEDEYTGQDAGERLAAYNVADDRASDLMDVEFDAGLGAEDDDDEYRESEEEEEESEGSEEEESSEEEEDDGAAASGKRKRGRSAARPTARQSWRSGRDMS